MINTFLDLVHPSIHQFIHSNVWLAVPYSGSNCSQFTIHFPFSLVHLLSMSHFAISTELWTNVYQIKTNARQIFYANAYNIDAVILICIVSLEFGAKWKRNNELPTNTNCPFILYSFCHLNKSLDCVDSLEKYVSSIKHGFPSITEQQKPK